MNPCCTKPSIDTTSSPGRMVITILLAAILAQYVPRTLQSISTTTLSGAGRLAVEISWTLPASSTSSCVPPALGRAILRRLGFLSSDSCFTSSVWSRCCSSKRQQCHSKALSYLGSAHFVPLNDSLQLPQLVVAKRSKVTLLKRERRRGLRDEPHGCESIYLIRSIPILCIRMNPTY